MNLSEAEASIVAAPEMDAASGFDLAWASNVVKRAWQQLEDAFVADWADSLVRTQGLTAMPLTPRLDR